MKRIPLTQNKFAIVDDEDYGWLNKWEWHFIANRYAARSETDWLGKSKEIFMHREIMKTPNNMQTDHINGNGLDNRKKNLRLCSVNENQYNQRKRTDNTSGYKGVSALRNKWQAQIRVNKTLKYLGTFDTPNDAALAYDIAARKYHGKFASLNFPD